MKIVIKYFKTKSKKLNDFRNAEWKKIHPDHFGNIQDEQLWKKKKFIFEALVGKELVGSINGDYLAGVMYIDQLIVKSDKRGMGIGKKLLSEAENLARKVKLHKIYLNTGVGWQAVNFYKTLGFYCEAKINNFYEKNDFWIMSKNIGS